MSELPPRHAAVIGINKYGYGIASLRSAVPDARAVTVALKERHGYADPIELLDAEATLDGIVDLLHNQLPARVAPDSGLVLYFAGHGVAYDDEQIPKGYLIPQDARSGKPETWLSMDTVRQALGALDCRHLLVVLDCCYAGSFRWAASRKIVVPSFPLYDSQYARFLRGQAWQVLTSASHDQLASDLSRNSRDREGWEEHSPFAAAFLEGLAGEADSSRGRHGTDGVITATELYQYVFEVLCPEGQVPAQTPGLWPLKPENTGEFIFLNPRQEKKTLPDPPLDDANNPWLGFRSYDESDAPLFFGRERVVGELLERLRDPSRPLLAVVGTSGSGKSSVVRAGLLPRLKQPPEELRETVGAWTVITAGSLRVDPLGQLDEAELRLAEAPEGHRKLLFIDPFEDLFLPGHDAAVQDGFLDRLGPLMTDTDPVRVLLTLRSGFEPRLKKTLEDLLAPASGDLQAPGPYELPAPTLDELREIVEEPATAKALYFEPGELVDELIEEVIGLPGALPLLSFTLARMYRQARERRRAWGSRDRALNRHDHKAVGGPEVALGGVAGAVHALADQLLEEADSAGLAPTVRRVALRMVSFEGWRGATRRRVCRRELEYADPQEQERVERVLDKLTAAHLLVVDREHLEPVHDALVRSWPPMKSWLDESGDDQLLLRAVWEAAEEWDNSKRVPGLLWDDDPRLPRVLERVEELNLLEEGFVAASVRRQHEVEDTRRVAVAGEWMSKDPTLAALVLLEVVNPDEAAHAIATMIEVLGQPLTRSVLRGHGAKVNSAVFNADGTKVLTASFDGTARVWNVDGSGEPVVLRGHGAEVNGAVFNPDGTKVVTASDDHTARVWNVGVRPADGPDGRVAGEPVVLRGHGDVVSSAAFNPDGTKVVTASYDDTARVWNADGSGKPVVLRGHEGSVETAAFSPDGTKVLTASHDETVRVWNVGVRPTDGPEGRTPGEPVIFRGDCGAFNADGTKVVTVSVFGGTRVWNADGSGEPVVLTGHGADVYSAAFNADGTKVLTFSPFDHTARVWNADGSGKPVVLRGHGDVVSSAAFNADGTKVVTASEDRTVRVWNVDGPEGRPPGEPLVLRGHERAAESAVFSPDGTMVVAASQDGTARVWNVGVRPTDGPRGQSPGKPVVLRGHESAVPSAAFNPDGTMIVTASRDMTARLWNVDGSGQPVVLRGHESWVEQAAFNADGTKVLTTTWGGIARVWTTDGPEGRPPGKPVVFREQERGVRSAAFNPDGTKVVTASWDGTAQVWNVGVRPTDGPEGRAPGEPVVLRGHQGNVWSAAFNADGTKIVTASEDRTARVWNVDGSGVPVVLRGHESSVRSAAFNADGTKVVTASGPDYDSDKTARVWNVGVRPTDGPEGRTAGEPVVFRDVVGAAFNPDGTKVLTVSKFGFAQVWNVDDPEGRAPGKPVVLRERGHFVKSAAFSADGTKVVTRGDWGAWVWNADGSGVPLVLEGHEGDILSAAFNADGTKVVTASAEGTARVWTLDPVTLQAAIRAATSACLPPDFRVNYLGESRVLAWKKYAECEISHGRCPEAYFFDPEDSETAERFLSQLSEQARMRYEELRRASTPATWEEP